MNRVLTAALCAASAFALAPAAGATTYVQYDINAYGAGIIPNCFQGTCKPTYTEGWAFSFIATAEAVASGKQFDSTGGWFYPLSFASVVTSDPSKTLLFDRLTTGNGFSATLCNFGCLSTVSYATVGGHGETLATFSGQIYDFQARTFEADTSFVGLVRSVPGVPEPSTWALMFAGFGMIGYAMRRRQAVNVTYA